MIYLIQAENGYIKIGSADDPHRRFKCYPASSPLQLRLIAILPGKTKDELQLHRRFDACRRHSEWFFPDGEMTKFVAEVWGQGLDAVADWAVDYRAAREESKRRGRLARIEAHKRLWATPGYREERAADRARYKLNEEREKQRRAKTAAEISSA